MKNLNYKIGILAALILVFAGCGKDYLNINVDPNNPSDVPNGQLLTGSQINVINALGVGSAGLGRSASVMVHQTMNRSNDDGYAITGNDFTINTSWQTLYAGGLQDIEVIIRAGTLRGEFQYVGVAKLLKAYTYGSMVDVWGNIPFTEATLGEKNPFPKFDDGSAVYASLFLLIDEAIGDLAKPAPVTNVVPGTDDLIYGGDLVKWRKFGKALKLKLYNNQRLTGNVSAQVAALVADPDLTSGISDFELRYVNVAAPENRNPAFQNDYNPAYINRITTYISRYFYEILANKSTLNTVLSGIADPRIPYYFVNQLGSANPTAQNPVEYKDGNFLTINFSSQSPNQGFDQGKSLTATGLYYCGGKFDNATGGAVGLASGTGTAPQRLYTNYNFLYNKAELAQVGLTTEDPRVLLKQAMDASFAKVNSIAANASVTQISTASITAYTTAVLVKYDAASAAGKLELIMTEKWIANFGNSLESYADYRRTGFPVMFDPATDGDPNTNLNRTYPLSFPWRQNDLNVNPNAPQQKLVATDRVFWDVN